MSGLVEVIRQALTAVADPVKAPEMRRYMKSAMPFLGVPKPVRARTLKDVFAAHPFASREEWVAAVLEVWRGAEFREERYAALDLAGRHPKWRGVDLLPVYDELVVTGAWWDFVDEIASRLVGPLLRAFPDEVTPVMRAWARDDDRWRRRVAVICQLGSKAATDLDLLTCAIEANADDPDFFLRKGIGWALRQHSRVDPDWVRAFVESHPGLSGLSKREALKHL
ncbi:3-methyladenine DNA glycosylase AlkD [Saccharothrix carnea]|uniref:3-methyladenine DNA glycosylase AlkD n=1 Tax=Saccharothrix carnea TaxID=1280637 RepID=A0A2P8HGB7_SACCR|nr:DNA alkylation repair protein [Saccharothrix carnea]PSL45240.1 3-methyladenine DNA glycosylase AlkD [Saccharothrix carnea]